jgi:hypothetical protein
LHTPIAFIIFNRPDLTERVFTEIAKAKPTKLFVIADGPRPDRPCEAEKCAAARAIIDRVDWECEVLKNYSDVNLGCGRRPATGISWVFEHVDRAIILEDDCVPHPTFFRFCEELLERYHDNERVMMIGGTTVLFVPKRTPYSYHFSRLPTCFGGWATWRRSWQHYDIEMKLWPALRETSWLPDILGDPIAIEFWQKIFDKAYAGRGNVDYWDYQWTFACWAQSSLAVLANTNLISNIGFREDATHTKSPISIAANLPTDEMVFPLQHPPYVVWDKEVDQIRLDLAPEVRLIREQRRLYRRLRRKLSAVIPAPLRKTISHLRSRLMGV